MDGATTSPAAGLPALARVLAIEASTERLSVALGPAGAQADADALQAGGPGGAQASASLIPMVMALLRERGWTLAELDAIAFGRGPGSFTGVRTACAVVQGLAVAARPGGLPVLPLDTLHAVAESALPAATARVDTVMALLDARMGEVYAAEYRLHAGAWQAVGDARVLPPEGLCLHDGWPLADAALASPRPIGVAGNARAVVQGRWHRAWEPVASIEAWPQAQALLRLADAAWRAGAAVPAAQAQPLYVRNQVALTTAEREAVARAKAAGQALPVPAVPGAQPLEAR